MSTSSLGRGQSAPGVRLGAARLWRTYELAGCFGFSEIGSSSSSDSSSESDYDGGYAGGAAWAAPATMVYSADSLDHVKSPYLKYGDKKEYHEEDHHAFERHFMYPLPTSRKS